MSNRYLLKIASFTQLGEGPLIEHGADNMQNYPQEEVVKTKRKFPDFSELSAKGRAASINDTNTGALINTLTGLV